MVNKNHSTAVEQIAHTIISTFKKDKVIFSDPISVEGVVVIPVIKVGYGLGGGNASHNEGAGGGYFAKPLGYIEIKEGESCFKSIRDPITFIPIIITGGIVASLLFKGLYKLFRG